jgi:DNA-binding PucR family transcriptional regulator
LVRARKAVDALLALGRVGVLAAAEQGLEQLILEATDPRRLVAFERQILDPLRAHDDRRGTQLVHTLESVYERHWNLQAAARALHVHVSTLRYRLTRIEELAHVDLGDQDDRLALHLALRIAKLLGAPAAPPQTKALKMA